ncbi:MAG: hypothetical protein ABIF40_02275 [archaeon]
MAFFKATKKHAEPLPEESRGWGKKVVITPDNAERLGFEILLDDNGVYQRTDDGRYVSRRIHERLTSVGYFPNYSNSVEEHVQETPEDSHLITLPDGTQWDMINERYTKVTSLINTHKHKIAFADNTLLPLGTKQLQEDIILYLNYFHLGARTMNQNKISSVLYEELATGGVKMLDSLYFYTCNIQADDPLVNIKMIGGDEHGWRLSLCLMEVKDRSDCLYQVTAGAPNFHSSQRHKWLLGAGSLDGYGGRTDYAELDFFDKHRRKF